MRSRMADCNVSERHERARHGAIRLCRNTRKNVCPRLLGRRVADWCDSPRLAELRVPVIPILFVIRAMARYILDADELVQRLHLEALAIAAGVVAVASLVGGFLAAAEVITMDGSILIWVFPVIALVFGIARAFGERRYARA